jgi:hypothetical protein
MASLAQEKWPPVSKSYCAKLKKKKIDEENGFLYFDLSASFFYPDRHA